MSWKSSIAAGSAAVFILIASPRTITIVLAQNEGGAGPSATPRSMMLPHIPQLQLQPIPGYGPAPLTVGFFAASTDPAEQFESYRWNFGDGQVSTLPPIALFHTYTNPGSYVVSCTATTTEGHQASGFAGIIVTQPAQ
jgi:PKD domain